MVAIVCELGSNHPTCDKHNASWEKLSSHLKMLVTLKFRCVWRFLTWKLVTICIFSHTLVALGKLKCSNYGRFPSHASHCCDFLSRSSCVGFQFHRCFEAERIRAENFRCTIIQSRSFRKCLFIKPLRCGQALLRVSGEPKNYDLDHVPQLGCNRSYGSLGILACRLSFLSPLSR